MSNPNMVQRDVEKLQGALDEIQAMQMSIDSMASRVKTALEKDAPEFLDIADLHDDLLQLEQRLLKIVPVLAG